MSDQLQDSVPDSSGEEIEQKALASQDEGGAPLSVSEQSSFELDSFLPLQSAKTKRRKLKTRTVVIGAIIVVGILVAVGGVSTYQILQSMQSSSVMRTETIEQGLFENTVECKGKLEPQSFVVVTPEIDGIIETVKVSEGSAVTEGDVLYTIKNDELTSAVTQAQSSLDTARIALLQAKNVLSAAYTARSEAEKNAAALAAEAARAAASGAVANTSSSSPSLSSLDTEISNAKLGVESANSALSAAQDVYDAAVARTEKRTVTSPMTGVVLVSNLEAGASLTTLASTGKTPLQIADTSKMIVKVPVNEVDIAKIEQGQKAEVTFSALPGVTCQAEVTHVAHSSLVEAASASAASSAGSSTVRYEVTLLIEAPDPRLKSGMTASPVIKIESIENALMVSSGAVINEGAHQYVLKRTNDEGEPERVEVKVVTSNETKTVIEGSAVHSGDLIMLPASSSLAALTGGNASSSSSTTTSS